MKLKRRLQRAGVPAGSCSSCGSWSLGSGPGRTTSSRARSRSAEAWSRMAARRAAAAPPRCARCAGSPRATLISALHRRAAGHAASRALAFFRGAVKPLVMGLQALPSICWLPLALLWFGLSEAAILFVVVMGSLLAIAIAAEDGGERHRPAAHPRGRHAGRPRPALLRRRAAARRRCPASSPASSWAGASPGAR